jgi:hypothetical protein
MIYTNNMLKDKYKNYANINTKIERDIKNGKYIRVVKGLYETNKNTSGYLLAGSIYGPSYLSFDFALAYYDLIPERVVNCTCAIFNKKKKKRYNTPFGVYLYQDVPSRVYYLGVNLIKEGDYYYQIATAEKALCDKLYTLSPLKNRTNLIHLLEDDLRIDKEDIIKLNLNDIKILSNKYNCSNVRLFYKYLESVK